MADFKPTTEAWTRYSEAALNAILIATPDIDPLTAAERASDYADEMLKAWIAKATALNEERKARASSESLRV